MQRAMAALAALALSLAACGSSSRGGDDAGAGDDSGTLDDGGTADYAESSAEGNDPYLQGSSEPTGLTLGAGDSFVLAGSIAAADQDNEVWADSDGFSFEIAEELTVAATLEHAAGATHAVAILHPDRRLAAWWAMSNQGRAVLAPVALPAGEYILHVAAAAPAPATDSSYTVGLEAVAATDCAPAGPADYTEADESDADHRANDIAAVSWAGGFPAVAATAAGDAAEDTGLSIEPGAAMLIEGDAAAVADRGDHYLDRDTYRITAAEGTTEIELRLEHDAGDVDLDIFAFAADAGQLIGTGVTQGSAEDRAVIAVEGGAEYWIWIGTRDERRIGGSAELPLSYRITVCGR